ncbi:hypothetical protein SCMU_01720 [Sinomonas cyclohexanicum]|uniref:Uncharacterized protein n=1 Tax=Sinomonas cyclohexanicum TaxID=322009 RepID=A0ABN6FCL7_SINCY|nr:hypothetical protein SCMU_01720 [Corynebacterium cyclohexanicum]
MLRIRDSVAGMIIEPNTPMSARAAMSWPGVAANAAAAETSAKPVAPMSRTRRRPILSPIDPIGTRRPARTSE